MKEIFSFFSEIKIYMITRHALSPNFPGSAVPGTENPGFGLPGTRNPGFRVSNYKIFVN
jgi:hypothetical protein